MMRTALLVAVAAAVFNSTRASSVGASSGHRRWWGGVRRPRSLLGDDGGRRGGEGRERAGEAGARRREPCYLRVKRGGAGRGGDGVGDYNDYYNNDPYYGNGGRGAPPPSAPQPDYDWGDDWEQVDESAQQAPPPEYWQEDTRRQRRPQQAKGKRRDAGTSFALGGEVGRAITQGNRTWGLACLAASVVVTGMGVSLFFNKFLIRLGNLALLAGVALLVGPSSCVRYFAAPRRLRGTIIIALGVFFVFTGHPIIGLAAELFGFLNLYGNMLPLFITFARGLPVIGDLIPSGNGGGGRGRKSGAQQQRRRPPPPPPQDDFFGEDDGYQDGYGDGYQQGPYGRGY